MDHGIAEKQYTDVNDLIRAILQIDLGRRSSREIRTLFTEMIRASG